MHKCSCWDRAGRHPCLRPGMEARMRNEQLRSLPVQVLPAATKMESADALAAAKKESGKCRGGNSVGVGHE